MIELSAILIGFTFGSFANNVITFFLSGKFDVLRSRCPECDSILKVYELVPLFSFLYLGGKCSNCNKRIPVRYPLVEIVVAVISLLVVIQWSVSLKAVIYFLFFTLLFVLSVIDFYSFRLPNILMITLFFVSLPVLLLEKTFSIQSAASSILLVVMFLLINWIYRVKKNTKAIGEGDIKLIGILTLISGFPLAFIGLWISALFALVLTLLFNGVKKLRYNNKIAFGPSLSLGYGLVIIYSNTILNFLSEYFTGN